MAGLFLRYLTVGGTVTVLLLPLLLGHRWLEGRYRAQTRWILWLSLAGVLLTAPLLPQRAAPVQVEVPTYALSLERPAPVPAVSGPVLSMAPVTQVPGKGQTAPVTPVVRPVAPVSRSVDWTELAAVVWMGVAALLLVGESLHCCLIRRRMMKASRPLEGEEARLRVLPGLGSPVTVGFCRPVVFLPSEETDPMALCHELTHIKRRDTWGKALLFLACALYWFHPLVWLMACRAGRDAEAACDAQLTADLSPEERKKYGELLLRSAERVGYIPFATCFGGSKAEMKARLTQLFRPGKKSKTLVCALLAAALMLTSMVACQQEEAETLPEGSEPPTPSAVVTDRPESPSPSVGAGGDDVSGSVEALIRAEHTEMERLRNFALDPEPDLFQVRWFTREELAAVGYPLEEGLEELACYEVKNAPTGKAELLELMYDQFEAGLAETLADDCLGGSRPLCFFVDGKMWHRGEYGSVWFEYDWDSLQVLNSNGGQIEYTLDGYSNVNNSGETPERKRWAFTLTLGEDGLWRYADTGREIFNEDAASAPTYAEWLEAGRGRDHSPNIAVMEDGTIWAWGSNRYGQLDGAEDGGFWSWGTRQPESTGLPTETE